MCNRVSTPEYDYLEKVAGNKQIELPGYERLYHTDAWELPFLPITTTEEPGKITYGRWKLLPQWAKAEKVHLMRGDNARDDKLLLPGSLWSKYSMKYRCLLWVDGFYEPHTEGKAKQPYYIYMPNHEPFTLGCIYSPWVDKSTGEIINTFAIVTTDANERMKWIHNEKQRMPLVITPDKREQWISDIDEQGLKSMLRPLPEGILQDHQVSNIIYRRIDREDKNTRQAQEPVKSIDPGTLF